MDSGAKLGHYEIRSKIGEGGMGEVYLAQDTKLDRIVALKILPADLALHRDRMERFVREAKSAAALSHPNIAQIFEIGEDHDTHFIAMEFVDGQTLRELIRGAFWALCGSLTSRVLALGAAIIAARILGKEVYGELGIVQSTLSMFGTLAGFGLGTTAMKYVAEHRSKDPAKAGRIIALWSVLSRSEE